MINKDWHLAFIREITKWYGLWLPGFHTLPKERSRLLGMWVPGGQILRVILREAPHFYLYLQVPNFKILGNDSDIYYTTWTQQNKATPPVSLSYYRLSFQKNDQLAHIKFDFKFQGTMDQNPRLGILVVKFQLLWNHLGLSSSHLQPWTWFPKDMFWSPQGYL